jgi:hypothetical protein
MDGSLDSVIDNDSVNKSGRSIVQSVVPAVLVIAVEVRPVTKYVRNC